MVRPRVWQEGYFNSRDENESFVSFNRMFRDKNKNSFLSISCFETRTGISYFNLVLRGENENRDWDNSREHYWELLLSLIYWLIFSKKKGVNFSNILRIICIFFSRNLNENLIFETRTRILFYQSRVPRREREIENHFSGSIGKIWNWFWREFPGMRITATLWFALV